MRRLLAAAVTASVAAAIAVLVAMPTPAGATGGYAPPQPVQRCTGTAVVIALPDTSVWGVSGCAGKQPSAEPMFLLHRTAAGAWSTRTLPYSGFPRAVADDGATTFFLFGTPYNPAENSIYIAKVPHSGTPSAARLLQQYSEDTVDATLVARSGKWWAAWHSTYYGEARETYRTELVQARTIEPAFNPRRIDLGSTYDFRPHLALRGAGAVLVATRGLGSDGRGGTRPVLATAGSDGTFTPRELGVPLSDASRADDLLVAGSRTLMVLTDGSHTLLAQDAGDLSFTTRQVPTRAQPDAVHLGASYGRVFVAHSESFTSSAGAFTSRVYVGEAAATGPFTTTEVSAPLARTNPAVMAYLLDVTAVRGRATVLTSADKITWSQTQR